MLVADIVFTFGFLSQAPANSAVPTDDSVGGVHWPAVVTALAPAAFGVFGTLAATAIAYRHQERRLKIERKWTLNDQEGERLRASLSDWYGFIEASAQAVGEYVSVRRITVDSPDMNQRMRALLKGRLDASHEHFRTAATAMSRHLAQIVLAGGHADLQRDVSEINDRVGTVIQGLMRDEGDLPSKAVPRFRSDAQQLLVKWSGRLRAQQEHAVA